MSRKFLNFGKIAIISLIVLGSITSCSRDISEIENNPVLDEKIENQTIEEGEELILGKQLENPYSLENMQEAMDIILKSSQKGSLSARTNGKPLQATHHYVVFIPENKQHLEILGDVVASRKFVTRDFPMDYEIVQYGEKYVDKRAKSPQLPVLYASIPVGVQMPNVPYQKLQDLYLTDRDNDPEQLLEFSALYLAKALPIESSPHAKPLSEVYSKTLQEHLNDNKQAIFAIFRKSYYPEGTVRVQRTDGHYQGLANAEIEIYNWFFNAFCHTDSNGKFRSPDWFRREMGVYLTWNSKSATISTEYNEILGIRRSDKIGNISRGDNNKTFDIVNTDRHKWRKATVHSALQEFNKRVVWSKVPSIAGNINIWVFHNGEHNGMAPMMKRHNLQVLYPSLTAIAKKRPQAFLAGIATIAVSRMTKNYFPDVIINVGRYDTKLIYQLVFHELAHVIHSIQVGGDYWGKFVQATLSNILSLPNSDPYGNGMQPSPEEGRLIALCEGWANFLEYRMMTDMYDIYSEDFDDGIEDFRDYEARSKHSLESFQMYTVPTNISNSQRRGWFLHGLMWDLTDYPQDHPTLFDGNTGLSTTIRTTYELGRFWNGDVFKALGSKEKTGYDLKRRMLQLYPTESENIKKLFYAYGY